LNARGGAPPAGTLLLARREVADLLDLDACIDAVEAAFRAHAEGSTIAPGVLSAPVAGGGFHLKTAGLAAGRGGAGGRLDAAGGIGASGGRIDAPGGRPYFAAKLNGNFAANRERHGLPRIQGLIVLCDAGNGYPLAVLDSTEITAVRTAAATAVAARHLARPDAEVATVCGCGVQGRVQLAALRRVLPIAAVQLCDVDPEAAARLAAELAGERDAGPAAIRSRALRVEVVALADLGAATRRSDVVVTSTPSRRALLGADDVRPGAFVAAVGADSEEKQELAPELLARARVVVDHLEQCATIGELHHALDRGVLARADVHAELHEVVAGRRPGRTSPDEVFVFDSTGVALEDVAAAALVYERAVAAGVGSRRRLLD
jgi:ornithine cyclodeaminase/alanine dehydrogenase-like protein (mu-crystallin family)